MYKLITNSVLHVSLRLSTYTQRSIFKSITWLLMIHDSMTRLIFWPEIYTFYDKKMKRVKHWPVCLLPFDFSLLFALLPDFDVVIVWSAGPVQDGAGGGSQVDVSVLLGPHAPGLQTPRARPSHTPKSYNHWSLENHHVLPRFYKNDFFLTQS